MLLQSFTACKRVLLCLMNTCLQIETYNASAELWQRVRAELATAMSLTGAGNDIWRTFWAAQQRFFKLLCVSLKIPTITTAAKEALAAGQCVVIGLQSTGAICTCRTSLLWLHPAACMQMVAVLSFQRMICQDTLLRALYLGAGEAAADAMNLAPGQTCTFISAVKEILRRFVQGHFPTARNVKVADAAALAKSTADSSAMLAAGHGATDVAAGASAAESKIKEVKVEVQECVQARDALLRSIDKLDLPPHFLDGVHSPLALLHGKVMVLLSPCWATCTLPLDAYNLRHALAHVLLRISVEPLQQPCRSHRQIGRHCIRSRDDWKEFSHREAEWSDCVYHPRQIR